MLEKYFERPTRIRQLRRGPLGPHLDDLAEELHRQGFASATAQHHLSLAGKFCGFMRVEGITDVAVLDEAHVAKFLADLVAEGAFSAADDAMRHLLAFLRGKGVIKSPAPTDALAGTERHAALTAYDVFLRDVRGLQPCTRLAYARSASRLLTWLDERPACSLAKLTRADVLTFVSESLERHGGGSWRAHVCSETRGFLRFLGGEGLAPAGLERAVPRARRYRLSSVPRHLPWDQVRRLIDSIDTSHPSGLRDKAVILTVAMLGLRNGEIRQMRLEDVRWRVGELRLPKTKSSKERVLPMPHEVGATLADYVLHGRPPIDAPEVFLRHRAPRAAFESSSAVAAIVALHLRRAGIEAPSRGAHLLRHSFATRLVNVGVPIKTIADILGHQSIDTSAIYTKVDTARLVMAALPFPTGGAR